MSTSEGVWSQTTIRQIYALDNNFDNLFIYGINEIIEISLSKGQFCALWAYTISYIYNDAVLL